MNKKVYIIAVGLFIMFLGYMWEQKQFKKKTYSNIKMERMSKKEINVPDGGLGNQDIIEANGRLSSYLVMENEAEKDKNNQEEKEEEKVAYLSFDDGPSEVTKKILDTLKQYEIKATFFIIGNEITENREYLLKRMVKEGHEIGIHTYTHNYKEIYNSSDSYIEDVLRTSQKIYEACGVKPTIYRFPWGSANCYVSGICGEIIDTLKENNLTYHDWNVSAEDSVGSPTEYSIMHNIEKGFKKYNQPVILMHDSNLNVMTAKMLPEIIEMMKKEGYGFNVVTRRYKPYQYTHK